MIKRYHTSAVEYFYSGQTELRTPPEAWATMPSPRVFDFDTWALPRLISMPPRHGKSHGEWERLKEFG